MADLFKDIIYSIMVTGDDRLDNQSDYVPYVVNRALSFHYDCVLQANQMNGCHELDNKLQYDFLKSTVRKYKRKFQPWQKMEKNHELEMVKEYYNYSNEKAKEALKLLSKQQLVEISEKLNKGGSMLPTK